MRFRPTFFFAFMCQSPKSTQLCCPILSLFFFPCPRRLFSRPTVRRSKNKLFFSDTVIDVGVQECNTSPCIKSLFFPILHFSGSICPFILTYSFRVECVFVSFDIFPLFSLPFFSTPSPNPRRLHFSVFPSLFFLCYGGSLLTGCDHPFLNFLLGFHPCVFP